MNALIQIEKFISGTGFFSKTIKLQIDLLREFEGFYGKASEDWENQVIITLTSPDETICPNIKITGLRNEDIERVAFRMWREINKWKSSK